MKICIFSNHFFPENFRINDIAFELSKKYDITVVTAVPDYPQGKFYDGYSLLKRRKEIVNGVFVYRLPRIPRGKGGILRLMLNYGSYFMAALFFTIFSLHREKYDAIFVHLTSPFFIGLPAVVLKRILNVPLVFWTLDLWPESLSVVGGIRNKHILNSQLKLVQYIYNNCDKILIGSQGFKKSICEKGDYAAKLVYFPNWAEDVCLSKNISTYRHLESLVRSDENDFIILFAGNIGEAQNLECVLDAAFALTSKGNKSIKFIFLGDGRRREKLIKDMNNYGLSHTVFFLGCYPLDSMPIFMRQADVLLVSLKDELIFNVTIPAKLQFYMAQSKPILAMINGDGADLVANAKCGITVPANNTRALQAAIEQLYNMPKNELKLMGKNGKHHYDTYFSRLKRIEQLDMIFSSLKKKQKTCETVTGLSIHTVGHIVPK